MTFEKKENEDKESMFRTVFTRGRVEIGAPLDPIEFNHRKTIKFNNLKKLLLLVIICALTLTVLLIIKQITVKDQTDTSAVQKSADFGLNLNSNSSANHLMSNITAEELMAQTSITTTKTTISLSTTASTTNSTTTEGTTTTTTIAPKIIEEILASIVINHATVPNRDGYVSLTDTYVKAFVNDHYIGQTPVQKETLNPVWNYQIGYQMTLRPDTVLKFKLYDNDKYTSHEFIGEFEIKTSELIDEELNGQTIERHHGSGHLWFTVKWEEVYKNY